MQMNTLLFRIAILFSFSYRSELGDSSYDFNRQGRWGFFSKACTHKSEDNMKNINRKHKIPFVKVHIVCRKRKENFNNLSM